MKDRSVRKYDYIDTVRGIAILGVVLVHTAQWIHPSGQFLFLLAKEGQMGVQLFYVASALTLFLSMNARWQHESRPLTKFYIRRFFRIAPLFYCGIILYVAYDGLDSRYWAPRGLEWWYIPLTATFLHGWWPTTINSVVPGGWSIAIEMTFYLIVPFLFARLTNIRITLMVLLGTAILSSILSPLTYQFLQPFFPTGQYFLLDHFKIYWFFSQLPVFVMGIVVYHFIKDHPYEDKALGWFLLFASVFIFTASLTVSSYNNIIPRHLFYGLGFILFVLGLHFAPTKILVNPVTTTIGKLSFSIYLTHFIVLYVTRHAFNVYNDKQFIASGNNGTLLAFALILGISIACSYFTHRFIEKPGIQLGKTIINKL